MAKKQGTADGDGEKKGGKKKIIMILGCVGLGVAGYMVGGGGAADPAASADATTTTLYQKPGCAEGSVDAAPLTVVDLPSMSINLADGHYLRLAVSLGLCDDVVVVDTAPFITAPARDIIVETLSGQSMDVLATEAGRKDAKDELTERILEAYDGRVFEIYLSEFVMQ